MLTYYTLNHAREPHLVSKVAPAVLHHAVDHIDKELLVDASFGVTLAIRLTAESSA